MRSMPSAASLSSSSVSRSASLETLLSATIGLEPWICGQADSGKSDSQGGGTDGGVPDSSSSGERVGEMGVGVTVVLSRGLGQVLTGRAGRRWAGGGGRRPLGRRSLDFLTGTGGGTGAFLGRVRSGGEVGGELKGEVKDESWDTGGLLRNGDNVFWDTRGELGDVAVVVAAGLGGRAGTAGAPGIPPLSSFQFFGPSWAPGS